MTDGNPTMTTEALLEGVARLPQAASIREADARRWAESVLRTNPARAAWHLARAGGFGGSEIGALVSSHAGDYHPFSSAREVVLRKLLVLPPDAATDDTRRGIELEDFVLDRFERHLREEGREFRRRPDLAEAIESSPHPDHPWLRASLDRVYEIDGAVCIVDAKAPTEEVLEGYKRYLDFDDYRRQLHHYRLAAAGKGIVVDRLILAMYEYRRNAIASFEVDHDDATDDAIIKAGNRYWDCVLEGRVPELETALLAVPDEGVPAEVEARARRFVSWKITADHAAAQAADARADVERWVARTGRLGDAVLQIGLMQVRGRPSPDVERMTARLREIGLGEAVIEDLRGPDRYDPRKLPSAYDTLLRRARAVIGAAAQDGDLADALAALASAVDAAPIKEKGIHDAGRIADLLVACKENPQRFIDEGFSSGLPRSKAYAVELAELREAAELRLGALVEETSEPLVGTEEVEEPDLEHPIARFAP